MGNGLNKVNAVLEKVYKGETHKCTRKMPGCQIPTFWVGKVSQTRQNTEKNKEIQAQGRIPADTDTDTHFKSYIRDKLC